MLSTQRTVLSVNTVKTDRLACILLACMGPAKNEFEKQIPIVIINDLMYV